MKIRLGISEAIKHWSKYTPNKICVISENFDLTYKELNACAESLASRIEKEYGTGNAIPIVVEHKALLLACIIGSLRSGNYPAIINPNLTLEEFEIVIAEIGEARLIVERRFGARYRRNHRCLAVSENTIKRNKSFASQRIWKTPDLDDTWGVLYSSGTTGKPKGIVRSYFSILSELLGWIIELETRKSSHYYIGRPLFYTGGLVIALAALLVGGSTSLFDEHEPRAYFRHLRQTPTELAFLIPSQILELIRHIDRKGIKKPPSARFILSMGAAFSPDLKTMAVESLRSDIIESWGNTEGLGTITSPSDVHTKTGSIGRPFLTDDLFILAGNRKRAKTGTVGLIAGEVDSRFSEYKNMRFATLQALSRNIVVSEDVGYQDTDGYFYLLGRATDAFVCNGQTVYPMNCEKVISTMKEVEEVAVVGIDSKGKGKVPVAFIKPSRPSLDVSALQRDINLKLNRVEQIHAVKIVKDFPKTASGKIKKEELKKSYVSTK